MAAMQTARAACNPTPALLRTGCRRGRLAQLYGARIQACVPFQRGAAPATEDTRRRACEAYGPPPCSAHRPHAGSVAFCKGAGPACTLPKSQ